ncbi:MAG: NUDIX domain-containing protein [Pseudomonadota bacterium]
MPRQRYDARFTRRAYGGFMNLDIYEASIWMDDRRIDVTREVHDHGHGAAVLPYDPSRRTALLARQLRLPVHAASGDGLLLEVAAGLIDPEDADAAAAAKREAREELGYTVHDLRHVATFYPIPGMVTEQMSCFLAHYGPHDKVAGDTGADADEMIEVEEWSLSALWAAKEEGSLMDGKALMCLMALRLSEPHLFE